MKESNIGYQAMPAVIIITYTWILGTPLYLIIATPAEYQDIFNAWFMIGIAIMACTLLSALALVIPLNENYRKELFSTQPNALALAIILLFFWVSTIIDIVVLTGKGVWYTWSMFKDSMKYALTEMERGITG